MRDIPDEMLMAYADDALSAIERRRVEAALAADASLGARLAPFVVTRSALPEIFNEALTSPLPARLIDTVINAPMPQPRNGWAPGDHHATVLARARAFLFPEVPSFGNWAALAATVVLIAGAGAMAGRIIPSAPDQTTANFASGALATALETAPLETAVEADGLRAVANNTFFDKKGAVCREYALSGDQVSREGIACRKGEGKWEIAFEGTSGAADAAPVSPGAITPSNRSGFRSLDDALDALKSGDVLGTKQDDALRANGWRIEHKN